MNPSAEYLEGLRLSAQQHKKTKNYNGKFLRPHRGEIWHIVNDLGCKTALDYGCGRGTQYTWVGPGGQTLEQFWGVEVTKYDPAYAPFAAEPRGTFDLVICTHVLGIIPIVDLEEWVIDRLFGFAGKAVFIAHGPPGPTQKRSKARWRTANIPTDWQAQEWLDLFTRHRPKGIEVHYAAKSFGHFVLSDTGMEMR